MHCCIAGVCMVHSPSQVRTSLIELFCCVYIQPLNSTPIENKRRMLVLAESSIFSVCLFTSQLSNSHHSQLHLFDIIKIMWIATKNSTKCCFNYFRFLIKLVIKMSLLGLVENFSYESFYAYKLLCNFLNSWICSSGAKKNPPK